MFIKLYFNNNNFSYVLVCSGTKSLTAELYDIGYCNWTQISNLNSIRENAVITYINDRYVYVIGGLNPNGSGYLSSFEYINANYLETAKWTEVNFSDVCATSISGFNFGSVIKITKDRFLICGGYNKSNKLNQQLLLTTEDGIVKSIEERKPMQNSNYFLQPEFVSLGNSKKLYCACKGNIMTYDAKSNTFKTIDLDRTEDILLSA